MCSARFIPVHPHSPAQTSLLAATDPPSATTYSRYAFWAVANIAQDMHVRGRVHADHPKLVKTLRKMAAGAATEEEGEQASRLLDVLGRPRAATPPTTPDRGGGGGVKRGVKRPSGTEDGESEGETPRRRHRWNDQMQLRRI